KVMMTLAWLCIPGKLSRDHALGKTQPYVSPMKVYILGFGLYVWIVGEILKSNSQGLQLSDDLNDYAEKGLNVLEFFVPLLAILILRLIWKKRVENYPFALHAYAFLFFLLLPAGGDFLILGLGWIAMGACWVYWPRRGEAPQDGRQLRPAGVLLRSLLTAAL